MHMKNRYYSLDVFRGAVVALMILVNNPGSWGHIYPPLEHAPWHGCTPTDLVFPFFLFAVGNALSFVLPTFRQAGTTFFLKKVIRRSILIFAIGLFLNWSPFVQWSNDKLVFKSWENIRILGVLQRIAICYLLASFMIYFFRIRTVLLLSASLLLLYWGACVFLAVGEDPYSLTGYFGTPLDISILGTNHMYKGEGIPFDPEGLLSTIPAVVQVVIGFLTGRFIQKKGKSFEMLALLFVGAVILTVGGYCWNMLFPINKKIWTSSYVLYTSGIAVFTLAMFIYMIEFRQVKNRLTRFFDVFGKNPLFIFVLSGFLPRLLGLIRIEDHYTPEGKPVYLSPLSWFYEHLCKPISADLRNGSLLYAVILILFYWGIVYIMDKKRLYIKV